MYSVTHKKKKQEEKNEKNENDLVNRINRSQQHTMTDTMEREKKKFTWKVEHSKKKNVS